jgi:bis(5'-nucleosyl)-tetraphosphatase (symmetrical)
MWGSEPAAWRDDLAGWDRLRVVVNAMTRMRYVTAAGAMEFRAPVPRRRPTRGRPDACPGSTFPGAPARITPSSVATGRPWAFAMNPICSRSIPAACGVACLTAVRLEDRRVFRQPCPQQAKPSGWD